MAAAFTSVWRGHWIAAHGPETAMGSPIAPDNAPRPPAHFYFARAFDLAEVPAFAPARMTGDSRYVLYINGQWVGHGPIRAQPRRLAYDTYDLAPFLRAGANQIAVHLRYDGAANSSWMPATANGRLGKSGVLVFEADLGTAGWLVSDARWSARCACAYTGDAKAQDAHMITAGIPAECFDARLQTGMFWDGFDRAQTGADTPESWHFAQTMAPVHLGTRGRSQPPSDPYGAMTASPLPPLGGPVRQPVQILAHCVKAPLPPHTSPAARVETSVFDHLGDRAETALGAPILVPPGGYLRLRIDFGRVVAGFVDFAITAPKGTVLDIAFHDAPITEPALFGAHGGVRYITRGANDRHRIFDKRGFRYAYLLISGAGQAWLDGFTVAEDVFQRAGTADFACSDGALTALYQAGRRTVQLCSWDAFLDCPSREQRAWVGDSVVHQMVQLATNADIALCWRALELGASPRPDGLLPMSVSGDVEAGGGFSIPDYSLHWIRALHNLWMHTADSPRVLEYLPVAQRILRWFAPYLNGLGHLEHLPEWTLVDWSALLSDHSSSIYTALYARALRDYAQMALALGEAGSATWANALYARIKAGFEAFYDPTRGVYVDQIKDGAQVPNAHQLASALAICAGLAPQDRWAGLVDRVTNEARLVRRSWLFPTAGDPPQAAGARFGQMIHGNLRADWDVQGQIVMAEPFMSHAVHEAVALAGRAEILPRLLAKWQGLLTGGYDTFAERWGPDGQGAGSRVHGWSAAPAHDLPRYVLGITPAAAGFARVRIAPRLGALAFAAGSVPCPQGVISVAISGSKITLNSPVPVVLDLAGRAQETLPAGQHTRPC